MGNGNIGPRGAKVESLLKEMGKNKRLCHLIKTDKDLFIGIRYDSVNLYYMGASAGKITKTSQKLKYEFSPGYWKSESEKPADIEAFLDNVDLVKKNIKKYQNGETGNGKKREKIAQQAMVCANNKNSDAKWFCIDMEYVMSQTDRSQLKFGRFDIVAITKEKQRDNGKYGVALIELKHGCGAYGVNATKYHAITDQNIIKDIIALNYQENVFGCGITGHVYSYLQYLTYDKPVEGYKNAYDLLKHEIVNIVTKNNSFGLKCPIPNEINVEEIEERPKVYFITVGENVEKAKIQMKKYLFNGAKASSMNVELILKEENMKKMRDYDFNFYFSEANKFGDDKIIKDIINDESYTKESMRPSHRLCKPPERCKIESTDQEVLFYG